MKRVEIVPAAEAELRAAAEWLEADQPKLGSAFVSAVEETFEQIERNPNLFQRWDSNHNYRRAVLRRFPYVIVYEEHPERIDILAIANAHREPGYWLKRVK